MIPRPFRVVSNRPDTPDTVTLTLEPADGVPLGFAPGQFTMIGTFGAGEVPISISGDPAGGPLVQTIRDVGGVSHSLARAAAGDVLTVRGPYGTGWNAADGAGGDLVIVAGGIGLAPLRSVVLDVLANRDGYGRVTLLYGARSPAERLYPGELADWAYRGIEVGITVDRGAPGWAGRVGLVTALIRDARLNPARTLALVCGPEVMMRFVAAALRDEGAAGQPDPAVHGTQHGLRHRPVRALPAPRVLHLHRRPGVRLRPAGRPADRPGGVRCPRRAPPWRCGSSPPATAASSPC